MLSLPPVPTRRRPLIIIFLLVFTLIPLSFQLFSFIGIFRALPTHLRYNEALRGSPTWVHPFIGKFMPNPAGPLGEPPILPGLRSAKWMGEWELPKLTKPMWRSIEVERGRERTELASPAVLMLHIFSMPTARSRARRALIRQYHPLATIPAKYRHLVDLKFILGRQQPGSEWWDPEEEAEMKKEERKYGDLVRLKHLHNGENMNEGKTWEWLRWVGREGGREAWWVLKCDDDTLPILPNLLPMLLSKDPSVPTYVGSALGRWPGYHYYFEGMMYGFSWGVVKTMATADVPPSERNYHWDEDARMGALMFSLPLSPLVPHTSTLCAAPSDPSAPNLKYSLPPINPDPCTGLVRLDLGPRIGNWQAPLILGVGKAGWGQGEKGQGDGGGALGWHMLKSDEDYIAAYEMAKEEFKREHRPWRWVVPEVLDSVATH
ncbi:hypothetical protein IAT38_003027 [Cryptococcus sp. DSM 104549]